MAIGLKNDVIAGFSVFLLALPLCLGIASASSFPPIAGILSAIVGGMIASCFGGAKLSIKGPAAGLIVIVLGAVTQLGDGDLELGYQRTLAVGVVASVLQILIAAMKKAVIAEIMPPSVIHGMLAAIGIIIVSKQSYVMIGVAPTVSGPLELLGHLPSAIPHLNPIIFLIGVLALILAVIWPSLKKISVIPSSLIILLMVIPLSVYFNFRSEHTYTFLGSTYSLGPGSLINIPQNFFSALRFPDFSVIFTPLSLKYIIMFTLIGSIESLLTACAVDSLAAKAAPSNLNKDLCAVGIGNLVSSLVGGLPMISEIIRSKANIDYGAVSARANFFHGLFMLLAVILLPKVINLVPLSALAALLVFIGLKLASPREFMHAYRVGKDQFALFVVTCLVTLATDLLMGVAAGIVLKLILHVSRGNKISLIFKPIITVRDIGESKHIYVEGALTFVSYLKLKSVVTKLAHTTKNIVIHLSEVTYLDYTVLKKFQTLGDEIKDATITIQENQEFVKFYDHPLAARKKKIA